MVFAVLDWNNAVYYAFIGLFWFYICRYIRSLKHSLLLTQHIVLLSGEEENYRFSFVEFCKKSPHKDQEGYCIALIIGETKRPKKKQLLLYV